MEVFRELSIDADPAQMAEIVERIERQPPPPWARDRAAELDLGPAPPIIYCFTRFDEDASPEARVILAEREAGHFHVSNIIPLKQQAFSYQEYNSILLDFHDRALRGVAGGCGLGVRLTGPEADLEHWMSAATAEKLRRFSLHANKRTGSAHWADRGRWNDFVLSAHRERCRLDPSTLFRWLIEVGRWPEEVADQLALEYEFGRELLEFAEEPRRSA